MLLATTNTHKVKEIQALLKPLGINVEPLGDTYPADPTLEETGDSFCQNSKLKAIHYNQMYGLPTLADDSGLVIPALDGEPGVHSARYLGEEADYPTKMSHILERLSAIEDVDRTAYFACAFSLAIDGEQKFCIKQNVFGQIAPAISGEGGFGYDPIFFYPELNKTFAEIDPTIKNQISHRGRAAAALVDLLETHPAYQRLIS